MPAYIYPGMLAEAAFEHWLPDVCFHRETEYVRETAGPLKGGPAVSLTMIGKSVQI